MILKRQFASAFCPFKTLNIPQNSTKKQIKQAFLQKAKETHPDLRGGRQEEFLKVRKAYDILTGKQDSYTDSGGSRGRTGTGTDTKDKTYKQERPESFYQNRYAQSEYQQRYARYRATGVGENEPLYGPHWRIVLGISIVSAIAGMGLLNLFEIQRDKFMSDREAAFQKAERFEERAKASRTKLPPKG
jgi:DnaJ-class molecular chaperone